MNLLLKLVAFFKIALFSPEVCKHIFHVSCLLTLCIANQDTCFNPDLTFIVI